MPDSGKVGLQTPARLQGRPARGAPSDLAGFAEIAVRSGGCGGTANVYQNTRRQQRDSTGGLTHWLALSEASLRGRPARLQGRGPDATCKVNLQGCKVDLQGQPARSEEVGV